MLRAGDSVDHAGTFRYCEEISLEVALLKQLLVSCLLMCATAATQAAQPECGTIGLAFYELGALYYQAPNGNWAGIDKDVIDEVAKRTGCKFQSTLESRVRIWTQLSSGKLDMSVSGIPTPEREKFARFIPYFVTRNYVLMAKSLPASAATAEGFLVVPEYKVAVVKSFKHGADYDAWLDKLRAQGRVYDAPDFRSVVRLLKLGRVHAVLALPTSWVPVLEQEGMTGDVRILDWSPRDALVHGLIVSRERVPDATADRMAKAIHAMRDDGTLLTIFKRHIGPELAGALLAY